MFCLGALVAGCGLIGGDEADLQASTGAELGLETTVAAAPAVGDVSSTVLAEAPVVEVLLVDDSVDGSSATLTSETSVPVSDPSAGSSSTTVVSTPTSTPTSGDLTTTSVTAATTEPVSTSAPTTGSTAPEPAPTSTTVASTETTATTSQPAPSGLTYKGIVAAGDDSITAFDNARRTVRDLFLADGVQSGNLIELSRQSGEQVNGVRATTVDGIEQAMRDLQVGDADACIVFLTSHGNRQAWFVRGANGLTPDRLDQILGATCGTRPTVALISACYSGIFLDALARPNRVVLTAASPVNTSFGCSPEATYTYWDGCLIQQFPQATTWEDLYRRVTGCIEGKEASAGVTPSRPQAHFGAEVANLSILNR